MHLLWSHFVGCRSFLLCGQSIPQTSKREKVRHMFLTPVYFLLTTLGGVEGLNNLTKLKENMFEQLHHEDDYLYLYLYLYCYCFK